MSHKVRNLRFNFGYLIEADFGTSRDIELDYPEIKVADDVYLSPLQGRFRATRTSKGIYVKGMLASQIAAECSRCLDEVILPIDVELDDLFYWPPPAPPGEFAVGDDRFVDLAPLVREISLLAIPMQLYCRVDCQGLCISCGQDFNQGRCDCPTEDIDPRLAILRSLLDSES